MSNSYRVSIYCKNEFIRIRFSYRGSCYYNWNRMLGDRHAPLSLGGSLRNPYPQPIKVAPPSLSSLKEGGQPLADMLIADVESCCFFYHCICDVSQTVPPFDDRKPSNPHYLTAFQHNYFDLHLVLTVTVSQRKLHNQPGKLYLPR